MCETEIQNASTVCPESVRPLWSTIVTDTMTGTRCPDASKYSSMANSAAFAFSVSKIGLDQEDVDAAFHQAARLLVIDLAQLVEGDAARRRAVHILGHRGRAIGRPHRTGHQTLAAGMRGFEFVGDLAGDSRARDVERVNVIFEAVIQRGNRVRVERIGLDDVRAGFEICALNRLHDLRLRDVQDVEISAQVLRDASGIGSRETSPRRVAAPGASCPWRRPK